MPHRISALFDANTTKAADMGAASSALLAGAAWLAEVEPYITALAGLVAIAAGAIAAWYHFERALATRAERKRKEQADK